MKRSLLLGVAVLGTILTGCAVGNEYAAVRFGPPPAPRYGVVGYARLDGRLLGLARRTLVLGGWPLAAPAASPRRLGSRLLARRPPSVAFPARLLAIALH